MNNLQILIHLKSNPTTLSPQKLEQILSKIRFQAHHCGSYIAFQQLLLILVTIYFSTSSIFAIVTILSGPVGNSREELTLVAMVGVSACLSMTKLYYKIGVAVGISKKVIVHKYTCTLTITK